MHSRDKISKATWTLHETVKDAIISNVAKALQSGQIKVETTSVEKLLMLVAASADEGYNRGHKSLMKTIDSELVRYSDENHVEITADDFEAKKK
jgi:hypothetical protein